MLKKIDWKIIASLLVVLFYLPMLIHTQYNSDILTLYDLPNTKVDILGQMKDYLLTQAKPLFGIVNVLTPIFGIPAELVVGMGLACFMFANFKLVNYFFANLKPLYKTIIFLLLSFNPYLYQELTWYEQFFYNGLLAIAIYYALAGIVKHHKDLFSFKKLIMVYALPILVVLISLNFFMTIYFHFIVLAMVFVLKRHFDSINNENNFKTIKEVLLYAKPFLIVVILGGLIYVGEIFSLWAILDWSYIDFKNSQPWRTENISSFSTLKKVLFVGVLVIIFVLANFLKPKNLPSLFLFMATCVVYASSYVLYIFFGMRSTMILNYPNFYLTIMLLGFYIASHQNHFKITTGFKIGTFSIIVVLYGFMSVSYISFAKYEKSVVAKLSEISKVVETVAKVENPQIVLLLKKSVSYKRNKVLRVFFPVNKAFHGFKGIFFGYPHINMPFTFLKIPNDIEKIVKELRKAGKTYPNTESIFKVKDTYYIVV